ncbi:unnamed protein product [Amoebophrya sp. A120]|nr:unnamed protein product [Amoebophrya sp. A120]|eukprot:GSA120T00014011001.1
MSDRPAGGTGAGLPLPTWLAGFVRPPPNLGGLFWRVACIYRRTHCQLGGASFMHRRGRRILRPGRCPSSNSFVRPTALAPAARVFRLPYLAPRYCSPQRPWAVGACNSRERGAEESARAALACVVFFFRLR